MMKHVSHTVALSAAIILAYIASTALSADLTIYNQNFGVVKERRSLALNKGENSVRITDITAHLEPDSVVLRDLGAGDQLKILEQDYESEPLSEQLLLGKMEGKEISFALPSGFGAERKIVKGRILRSGYVPH